MAFREIKKEKTFMKKISLLLVAITITLLSTLAWSADELEIINGERWVASSVEEKRAYLFGVGNMLELEQAMMGKNYEAMRKDSIVHVLLEGLAGISIADLMIKLDQYYANSPQNKKKAVIEVLYIDMAKANLKH